MNNITRFEGYKTILEQIDLGIVYQDKNGNIEFANQAAQNILGLSFEQLCGRDSLHPEWRSVHADGSNYPGNEHPAMQSLATGKPVFNKVMGVFHPNKNGFVWIMVNAYPFFTKDGKTVDGVFTNFNDITKEVTSQNELEYQLILSGILMDATTKFINLEFSEIDNQINGLLARMGSFLAVDRFYVFTYDFEKSLIHNTHEWCADGIEPQIQKLKNFPMDYVASWIEINREGKPFILRDSATVSNEDPFKKILLDQGIKSMYCVPIMVKNACVGMVGFDAVNKLYDFNDYEKNLLAVFAQLIANIEERKENHTLINETLKELNGVYLLSQLNAEMGICLSDYFKRTCEIICHSFFIPSQTYVAISYLNEQYFSSNFIATKKSIEKELILPNQTKIGNLCICIPEENNFLESEIEFVNNVARLILQKYNKDLFEESLLKSEEKYRIIAENNYNWEFWEGPDGTFLYHSPACLQVTGYTAEELLADQVLCHTLIHPKDIKGFGMHQEYVLLNKEPGKHNFRLVAKNGEVKYIEHVCKPVYANDGTFLGTRGSNIVVTEKVEAFNKLSKSEQRLNNLLNSQTSYVLRTDLLGRHTFWNKAFEEAFGWMYKEKGLTEADSLTSICDYDKPKAAEVVSKCFKNPGKIFKVQLDKPSKDGSIVNTAWDFVCITDDAGKPFEIQCIGIDVTESVRAIKKLQENEQWLGSLLNSQTSFVLRTDMQGRHTYWNHSFEEKFGWIYENGLNHENSLKSICTHHHQRTLETVNECISNPGKIAKVELDKPGKDGDIVTTLWEFVCLASELGEPIEIQCMGIDITDRRKSEEIILDLNQNLEQKVLDRTEELNKTNKELELAKLAADTANQEKSLFLSRMSHELRTPMNSILGFAQILEMATLDERQKRGVGHIIKSGNHLLNLINEVLDIARIESGKVSLSLESVALNAVVAEVLDLTAPAADTRKINIDFAPAIDFHVVADKQRLKQVLINVVNNAIKYNSVGGKVWIETKQEGDYVKVLINDNGFGIKSENLTKLFVPFERLGAEKHQIEGTGLGLSVVKQLMHSMQGKMGVESVYGGGSTFWLSFKIAKNQNQIIEDLSHDISEIANYENEGPNQGKLMHTILYIEDNISNIELVETILQNTRPELNLVTDTYGRNAVALAKLHKPKLILLDLNLPDMHGSEVLDTLKLDGEVNDIPVVVLSADAMEKQVKYMLDLGAVKYITKPFQIKEFVDLIDVYCK